MVSEKTQRTLLSLHRLWQGSTGNESRAAFEQLQKLLDREGLTIESLDNDLEEPQRWTRYVPQKFRRLFAHCVSKAMNTHNLKIFTLRSGPGSKTDLIVESTLTEKVKIEWLFEFYSVRLEEDLKNFEIAWIAKNRLRPEVRFEGTVETMSDEDYRKIREMYESAPFHPIAKPLNSNNP